MVVVGAGIAGSLITAGLKNADALEVICLSGLANAINLRRVPVSTSAQML